MGFSFIPMAISKIIASVIKIGHVTEMVGGLQLDVLFILNQIWSPSLQRNNMLCEGRVQSQNIESWHWQQLKFYGLKLCKVN